MHSTSLRRVLCNVTAQTNLCQVRNAKWIKWKIPIITGVVPDKVIEEHRTSNLNKDKEVPAKRDGSKHENLSTTFREHNPEFLPEPDFHRRDRIKELLVRRDMYQRRKNIHIPEFYVGSTLAVTVADKHSPGKSTRFVGMCIDREGYGLRHNFILRNVIDDQGLEVLYEMYNPLLLKIEVLKLEKRLDEQLYYLRDCSLEYSYIPQDFPAQLRINKDAVPVNTIQVPLGPKPWTERWERSGFKGLQPCDHLFRSTKAYEKMKRKRLHPEITRPWEKVDIMKHYRESTNPDAANEIYKEVSEEVQHWKKE